MPGPLSNLKVLDFSTLLPGPYATMLLADMGAEVIKVEGPGRPDVTRTGGTRTNSLAPFRRKRRFRTAF